MVIVGSIVWNYNSSMDSTQGKTMHKHTQEEFVVLSVLINIITDVTVIRYQSYTGIALYVPSFSTSPGNNHIKLHMMEMLKYLDKRTYLTYNNVHLRAGCLKSVR